MGTPFMSKKMPKRIWICSTEDMFEIISKEQVPNIINGGSFDDEASNEMYREIEKYIGKSDLDHFAQ